MAEDRRVIYWDACAFLSYINEYRDRMPVVEALLADSAGDNGAIKIYTSTLSRVEVAFAATEQVRRALDQHVEERIDHLWADPGAVVTVEFHDAIGTQARQLMRDSIARSWSLRPNDAIHLATAQWLRDVGILVDEFHTYDSSLHKYAALVDYRILEPYTSQPNLL